MNRLVVLGAGTAGTVLVNRLRPALPRDSWQVTAVDADDLHRYQPGYLLLPFRGRSPSGLGRSRRRTIGPGVDLLQDTVEGVDPQTQTVHLSRDGRIPYDYLVIATGTSPRPDRTPGMLGPLWRRRIHEFYTMDGAVALREALQGFRAGRLVVHTTDVPIKCPVAPLEFTFLADAWLRRQHVRNRVEIVLATPLSGAFTKPTASRLLGSMLEDRDIRLEPDFMVERIDQDRPALVSYDERELPFDLLVTVPLNVGSDFVGGSGLGDPLNYVAVDRHTFRSTAHANIFALGDAADLPASKAGSAAHEQAGVLAHNFPRLVRGAPMDQGYGGHVNRFLESGRGRGLLLDFDYGHEPRPGRYPFPHVGPFTLLGESRVNHWGKVGFPWFYWNILLPGRSVPGASGRALSTPAGPVHTTDDGGTPCP